MYVCMRICVSVCLSVSLCLSMRPADCLSARFFALESGRVEKTNFRGKFTRVFVQLQAWVHHWAYFIACKKFTLMSAIGNAHIVPVSEKRFSTVQDAGVYFFFSNIHSYGSFLLWMEQLLGVSYRVVVWHLPSSFTVRKAIPSKFILRLRCLDSGNSRLPAYQTSIMPISTSVGILPTKILVNFVAYF